MIESSVLLQANELHKSFFKANVEIPVLSGIHFSLKKGEMVAITGPSGSGKSTLLHVLGTLEPPSHGQVFFEGGKNLFQLSEKKLAEFRNQSLGFMFQFHYLLPEFNAVENVMMPALIAGHNRAAAYHQALELLKFVGLEHRVHHRPGELSGGEQQRVSIARAVILRPRLLLADELTGNLDSANAEKILDLLIQLNEASGVSILMVTHDEKLAGKMHRVLAMRDGRLFQ